MSQKSQGQACFIVSSPSYSIVFTRTGVPSQPPQFLMRPISCSWKWKTGTYHSITPKCGRTAPPTLVKADTIPSYSSCCRPTPDMITMRLTNAYPTSCSDLGLVLTEDYVLGGSIQLSHRRANLIGTMPRTYAR